MEKIHTRFFTKTVLMRVSFYGVMLTSCWLTWATPSLSAQLSVGSGIDSIVVVKHQHRMYVYEKHNLLKIYPVALGSNAVGPKHFKGDGCTPEGIYHISNKNPNSKYHKSLAISYPSAADRNYAWHLGKDPGGDVMIHGLPNGEGYIGEAHLLKDWTLGCIAVTDWQIDELYAHVVVGTPVNILP